MNNNFKEYLLGKFKELSKQDKDFLFFDTETTGLGDEDEIIELAIIDRNGNKVYESRFKPTQEIDPNAQNVHGLSNVLLNKEPLFENEYNKIKELIEGKTLYAYNVNFDKSMLDNSCKKYKLELFKNVEFKDLAIVKEENETYTKYYNLNSLMKLSETPFRQDRTIHGALIDTYAIYDLFTQNN